MKGSGPVYKQCPGLYVNKKKMVNIPVDRVPQWAAGCHLLGSAELSQCRISEPGDLSTH